jgi:long-chain acyl-CoA synthetase
MHLDRSSSLVSVVANSGVQFAGRPALAEAAGLGGEPLSYARLWDQVQRGSCTLRQAGLSRGDRVALAATASPGWAPAFFSILHSGMIAVPLTADTPASTLAAIAAHAGVSACVHSSEGPASSAADLEGLRRFPIGDLFLGASGEGGPPVGGGSDLAVLAFTSGSTRHPLAVELTHTNLLSDLDALLQVRRADPGDVFLSMLPPAHLFELMGGLLGPLACGAKVVYPGSPLPNRLVDSLREDRITHACCVPALLHCLYEEVLDELALCGIIEPERRGQPLGETARRFESGLDAADRDRILRGVRSRIGSTLKTLVLGGAALDPAWSGILCALGVRSEIGYGLTEAGPIVCLGLAGECPPGSVGRPLPGVEVQIDPAGEILVRGPNVTSGYYRNPEATREAFVQRWLRTGDCGRLDAEGFLFLTGRLKEAMVTSAGETIYPEEVEPYYASPLFAEWCVAGWPGPDGNDVPTLFVVPAQPERPGQTLAEAFQQLRAKAPARFRLASMVCLNQALPRTALGKPRRRAVVAFWQQQTSENQHA